MPLTSTDKNPDSVAKDPTPTVNPLTRADQRKRKSAERRRDAQVGEFKTALTEAQAEVADAFGDLKAVLDAGQPVASLAPLMAAIDDLTAAVGDITAHGARNSWLSNDDSKSLRDAQNHLTQAFSDVRTNVEFPSAATDVDALGTVIENMDAAIAGVGKAKP
jgi:hypothetical protein